MEDHARVRLPIKAVRNAQVGRGGLARGISWTDFLGQRRQLMLDWAEFVGVLATGQGRLLSTDCDETRPLVVEADVRRR
jgi:hypothetical protein